MRGSLSYINLLANQMGWEVTSLQAEVEFLRCLLVFHFNPFLFSPPNVVRLQVKL